MLYTLLKKNFSPVLPNGPNKNSVFKVWLKESLSIAFLDVEKQSTYDLFYVCTSEALQQGEGTKKIQGRSINIHEILK